MKLTEEQIEVLKNPHSNLELLSEEFLVDCGFQGILTYHRLNRFSRVHFSNAKVDVNAICEIDWGLFSIYSTVCDICINFLENRFEYPLLPTKEERELFFIEFGFEYPIREYQIV